MKLPSLMNPFWKELQNFLQKTEPKYLCCRYRTQKTKMRFHKGHRSEAEGLTWKISTLLSLEALLSFQDNPISKAKKPKGSDRLSGKSCIRDFRCYCGLSAFTASLLDVTTHCIGTGMG